MKNRIKQIREYKGMTQTELARLTGLSKGYICHLEKGKRMNPSSNTMVNISKALNEDITIVFDLNTQYNNKIISKNKS